MAEEIVLDIKELPWMSRQVDQLRRGLPGGVGQLRREFSTMDKPLCSSSRLFSSSGGQENVLTQSAACFQASG